MSWSYRDNSGLDQQQSADNVKPLYWVEYAWQGDAANNPRSYGLNYFHLNPGVSYKGITAEVGWEYLEGDGTNAFQTPLATLHKFNGWADQFLTTPPDGLEDRYVSLGYTLSGIPYLEETSLLAVYHDFDSTEGGIDYGDEWDFKIARTFYKRYTLSAEFAKYDADRFATDTEKLWLTVAVEF